MGVGAVGDQLGLVSFKRGNVGLENKDRGELVPGLHVVDLIALEIL